MQKSTVHPSILLDSPLHKLEEHHRALLAQLANLGLVLRGSIAPRFNRCGNPTCRCKADPPVLHGPYYKWTRKASGKTVNATLTREQAERCLDWSRNMRKLDRVVQQLQAIGQQAAALLLAPLNPPAARPSPEFPDPDLSRNRQKRSKTRSTMTP